MPTQQSETKVLLENLIGLLTKGNSHVTLDAALQEIPFELVAKTPENLPYNLWQLAEHIRISQKDILDFSQGPEYQSRQWPKEYWPEKDKPSSKEEWENCLIQIKKDRESFIELLKANSDNFYKPFDHGDGQTLLREALVLADHNAYHTAEIIVLRRLLGNWGK